VTKWLAAAALAIFLGFQYWKSHRPIRVDPPPPVVLRSLDASEDPLQKDLTAGPVFRFNSYKLTALAEFSVGALVLLAEHYSTGRESDLAPVDLALAWGPMTNPRVLERMTFSQSNRFYYWRYDGELPLPRRDIEIHSANMHLIPGSRELYRKMMDVKSGERVQILGYLVQVEAEDGWRWRSSLTREDTGGGACELVFVTELNRL